MHKEEKILVIGNGFDLYHYLPTRYIDFLNIINRLLELDSNKKLSSCKYIKYLLGPESPIYKNDEYIQKCYEVHTEKMQSVELNQSKMQELVELSKNNVWIKYFQVCLEKNIRWIDFEKEIANVLTAVKKLFSVEKMTLYLGSSVEYGQITELDLNTIDILSKFPFGKASNFSFGIEEEYCKKGVNGRLYISIDKERIIEQLETDLDNVAKTLCIYLGEFVHKIAISKNSDNPVFYNVDKVLSFNYTDTYRQLYGVNTEACFIHGNILNENGVVLGINNDAKDELEEMDSSLIRFKKYYQRAIKTEFYSVDKILNDEDTDYKVSIVGHSIDITDKDILVDLLDHPRTKVTIFYHNKDAQSQQLVNLISLVGKKHFQKLWNSKKVELRPLREFREAETDIQVEEFEEEVFYEHKISRRYRIFEKTYNVSNTLLIENEIINISTREGDVNIDEIKLVDCFLNRQEIFNHSGLYDGVVKLVSLFNDNIYGTASAEIEYITKEEISEDDISNIKSLYDSTCEDIEIFISEVKIVKI